MEQVSKFLNWSQLGLYEYLLVAHPDSHVNGKIMAEKESFTAECQQKIAMKTKPHITIASFVAREAMEDTILRYTQRICCQQQSFEVALNKWVSSA
ncbi:MAG: hypothetical protein ACR2KZ_22635 [Segetibacter sp.]